MTTALFTHADAAAHLMPPGHPERVARIEAIWAALSDPAFDALDRREAPLAATDDLLPTLIRNHLAVADTAHQCLIQRAALIDAVRARELSERERSDAVLQALGTQGGRADGGRR